MKEQKAPRKKKSVKEKAETISRPKKEKNKYFQAIGRRKRAIARVRIYPMPGKKEETSGKKNEQQILVNDKSYKEYFSLDHLQEMIASPLGVIGGKDVDRILVKAEGGGIKGQAEAVRLGISRALVKWDEGFRKSLRDMGFLTRDARIVERKKAGLKKARRAPQWQKR